MKSRAGQQDTPDSCQIRILETKEKKNQNITCMYMFDFARKGVYLLGLVLLMVAKYNSVKCSERVETNKRRA